MKKVVFVACAFLTLSFYACEGGSMIDESGEDMNNTEERTDDVMDNDMDTHDEDMSDTLQTDTDTLSY